MPTNVALKEPPYEATCSGNGEASQYALAFSPSRSTLDLHIYRHFEFMLRSSGKV